MKLFSILMLTLYRFSRIEQDENTMRQSIGLEPQVSSSLENAHMKSGAWLDDLKKVQKRYGD
jgi:hypothetical protein